MANNKGQQSMSDLPDLFSFIRFRPERGDETQVILSDSESSSVVMLEDREPPPGPVQVPTTVPIVTLPTFELPISTRTTNDKGILEQNPSTCTSEYWLIALNDSGRNDARGAYDEGGKWIIFDYLENMDDAWKKVKMATEEGRLGFASEVSTLKNKQEYHRGKKSAQSVIRVYTPDWKDRTDCMRVREALRDIGFSRPLSYKSTQDTLDGRYRATGHKNFSKYYC